MQRYQNFFQLPSLPRFSNYFSPIFNLFTSNSTATSNNRKKTHYYANKTASIGLSDPIECEEQNPISIKKRLKALHQAELLAKTNEEIADIRLKKIELMRERIKWHAERRVDIFFYILIAVYGMYVSVERGNTDKQNGKGKSARGTEGCHCCLFPHLKISPLKSISSFFRSSNFSITNTHFEEVLNITVELPTLVNDFDACIEFRSKTSTYIDDLTKIINQVATCEFDPLQGMTEFFKVMNKFFDNYENTHFVETNHPKPAYVRKIWEYEKAGTFNDKLNPDSTLTPEYFYSILRVNEAKRKEIKAHPKLLAKIYKQLQNELFTSVPAPTLRKPPKKKKAKISPG